jgi:NADPH:quinone reductase-like Zn-dependent oxidoreductase
LSVAEAACIPLAGLTALQCLRDLGHLEARQRVLIIGASGGVGHLAVQIAKSYGANVTGVCSGDHVAMVGKLGADRVIDYTRKPDFLRSDKYDVILDAVVRAPVSALLGALTAHGRYVATLPSLTRIAAATVLPIFSKKRIGIVRVSPRGQDLDALRRLCESGELRPVIDKTFRLPDLAEAYEYSRQGRTAGKIAVIVSDTV